MIRNNKVGSWSDCRELVVGAQDNWEMRYPSSEH